MAAQSKFLSFALFCVVGIAGVGASLLWHRRAAPVDLATGTLLTPSRALPDFSLIDQQRTDIWPRPICAATGR